MAHSDDVGPGVGPGRILWGVFETLDRAGIPYCVLHGYDDYPQRIKSDVDVVIDHDTTPGRLNALLQHNCARIGAEVVRCSGHYFVLAGKNADGSPCFLTMDLTAACELDDLPFYSGPEVLDSRRRRDPFWIPAADLEFGCYLARSVAKGRLDDERTRKLGSLHQQDPAGCRRQLTRFWGARSAELIASAARSGDWTRVRERSIALRTELRLRAKMRLPGRYLRNKLRALVARMRRLRQPDGLNVVLLGPDGAGKSSVVEALGSGLAGVFSRSTCRGFAPPLNPRLRRGLRSTADPHGLPARSFLTSVVRAAYWFIYYTIGYATLRLALARSTLVLNDRHFVDILVDPKRYRYGGPMWLVRLISRLIPRPDLAILLDAPPEVLQARKQEVPFEETLRQREAYRSLMQTMRNAHVVDASQSPERVAADVSDIILRRLTIRIARRLGSEKACSAGSANQTLQDRRRDSANYEETP